MFHRPVFSSLIGILTGMLPGLFLLALGQWVTGGGDGMIGFGMVGVLLIVVGASFGGVVGWRRHVWVSSHLPVSLIAGAVSVVAIVAIWVSVSGPPDPILVAFDCEDVYHRLGVPEESDTLVLPALSDSQVERLAQRLPALELASGNDGVCRQLRADLEDQS